MAEFKLVIADPKLGKTLQKELKDDAAESLLGLNIGEQVKGEDIELPGYELTITGGSDYCGFPMRKGITGTPRKRIFTAQSVGFRGKIRPLKKGKLHRRFGGTKIKINVCNESISEDIKQINLKVIKYGKEPLFKKEEVAPEVKEETKVKEEKKAEA